MMEGRDDLKYGEGRHNRVYGQLDQLAFHRISPLGRFGLVVAKSVHGWGLCPLPMRFSQGSKGGPRGAKAPLIGPQIP